MTAIGSLNEKPLHAAIKKWYRQEGDQMEAPMEWFVVDRVRDGLLIEIQTRGFASDASEILPVVGFLFDGAGVPGGCREVDCEAR